MGLVLTTAILLALGGSSAGAAQLDPLASQPAANAVLAQPPKQVVLDAPAPVDPGASGITLLGADGHPVATAPARVAGGAPDQLVADVPDLPRGIYTVVWHTGSGSTSQGSFAFAVDPAGASPALVETTKPDDQLTPVSRAIPKWLAFLTIMAFIGTLALRFLVTMPSVRRLDGDTRDELAAATDRGLLVLGGAAILLFIPSTLADLVNNATDRDAGLSFWGSIRPGAIWDYLTDMPDGHVWLIRLGLTLLAAVVVLPAAVAALRPGWQHRPRQLDGILGLGLAAGVAELIARVVPTRAPPAWPREIFTDVLDWGHLAAASVWVGGLIALALLGVVLRRIPVERRGRFWPLALRRFSLVATVCVGVMILTGLWTAWIHVGPPRLLFHTLYGETLLVKLILVLVLVGLGALNQLWLLPRVNAIRESGGDDGERTSAVRVAMRHFRSVVAVEAVVGILILLVVPFLSGSARNQSFARAAADLTQTAQVAGQTVKLRPSGAEPGLTDYDVWAPAGPDGRVTVGFASARLGVPETDVLATALGGDHYRVSGLYTASAGDWQVTVNGGTARPATFDLTVTAPPADPSRARPARAPPAVVRTSTWLWGIAEVLAVLIALGGAGFVTRWLTQRRARRLVEASRA